jgi:hypothetical protein
MENATFAVPLATSNFDTVQTARRHDLDAQSTETHGVLRSALHGTTEHDPLQLLGDAVSDQLGIVSGAHFFDVDGDRHARVGLS